jgi:hypothetical protein
VPPISAQDFVAKWRQVALKERSASQSHFNDLCALLGQPTPVEADPAGIFYTFEAGASKQAGGEGWADVWKRGYFAWEYKGKHANLDAAYAQLLQYRESLENPPLLVVCDLERIVVHTNFTNTVKRVETFALDDLLDPARLDLLRAVWSDPERFRAAQTTASVTQQAAARFAELAERLRKYGEPPEAVAHFLIRLLFCLFAEDVHILPKGLFSRLVLSFRRQPQTFAAQLAILFRAMAQGGAFGFDLIPHVDGGLFDDDAVLALDTDGLDILAQVCALDWANIEPSILGTLFERGLDPAKRAQLGAHYTSREDILLIVEPVLMAPLRRRWEQVRGEAEALAAEALPSAAARSPRARAKRSTLRHRLEALLTGYARELAAVQVLDPACGSGNFLYVALGTLLDLWKQARNQAAALGLPLWSTIEAPNPAQLHGIEINPYAHELAQATLWIGYLQWLRDNGFGLPAEPILKPLQTVMLMDAILAYDAAGQPVAPAWPAADVIIGNPPFLGGKRLRTELGDAYVDHLFTLYAGRVARESDLVCYWFERARALIAQGQAKRAGLLATQGIRGGANRAVLQRIKHTGDIFFAWADRDWVLDGAAVHVSLVGFDDGAERERTLNGQSVEAIHPDLTSAADLTQAHVLAENSGLAFMGDTKVGPFEIDEARARQMLAAVGNPNRQPNSDVIRPWANGLDITRGSRRMWIIDFGTDMPEAEAAQYQEPFEYIKTHVKPFRSKARSGDRTGVAWWLHQRPRPDMRAALAPLSRYVVVPCVAKHLLFAWLSPDVLPDHALIAFARDDDYFLGVLHARPHALWARRLGTQLREAESGSRYTPTTCFETYPFPWPPGQEPPDDPRVLACRFRAAISAAARDLVAQREAWLQAARTLTALYNANPAWLQLAHRHLDEAVFAAYGWPPDLDDEEILRRLLALNQQRAP